jgi:hypothetical protein
MLGRSQIPTPPHGELQKLSPGKGCAHSAYGVCSLPHGCSLKASPAIQPQNCSSVAMSWTWSTGGTRNLHQIPGVRSLQHGCAVQHDNLIILIHAGEGHLLTLSQRCALRMSPRRGALPLPCPMSSKRVCSPISFQVVGSLTLCLCSNASSPKNSPSHGEGFVCARYLRASGAFVLSKLYASKHQLSQLGPRLGMRSGGARSCAAASST